MTCLTSGARSPHVLRAALWFLFLGPVSCYIRTAQHLSNSERDPVRKLQTTCETFDATKTYNIIAQHSGQYLAVRGASTASGVRIEQTVEAMAEGEWSFVPVGSEGHVNIINGNSLLGMSLDAELTGPNPVLQGATDPTTTYDDWCFEDVGDGTFTIMNVFNSGFYIDVAGISQVDGANVDVYYPNGGANQRFVVAEVGTATLAPTPTPPLPEIGGSIVAEMTVTFDDPSGGTWQTMFDFGNGFGTDNVILTQRDGSNDISFQIYFASTLYEVVATGAIIAGETAFWRCGVEEDGEMFIEKNGVRIAVGPGIVPSNVARSNKFIGDTTRAGATPLIGSVTDFGLFNLGGPDAVPNYPSFPGIPEVTGPFTASMTAVFENLSGGKWQRLFDFGNGPRGDNLIFTQSDTSNDISLKVYQDSIMEYEVISYGAIVEGETAFWRCGVGIDGEYWIEKDGVLLETQITGTGPYPRNVTRFNKFLGRSNWLEDTPLIGSITDFQLVNLLGDTPTPTSLPTATPATPAPTSAPTTAPSTPPTAPPTAAPSTPAPSIPGATAGPTTTPTSPPTITPTSTQTTPPTGTATKDVLTQCVLQCIDGAFPTD